MIRTFEQFVKKESGGKSIDDITVGLGFIKSYRRCWNAAQKAIKNDMKPCDFYNIADEMCPIGAPSCPAKPCLIAENRKKQ